MMTPETKVDPPAIAEESISTTSNATPALLKALSFEELEFLERAAMLGLKRTKTQLGQPEVPQTALWRARRRLALRRIAAVRKERAVRIAAKPSLAPKTRPGRQRGGGGGRRR